ncbi:FxsA family protein [Aliiglaciecola litoralis]|uniref:FxsA family protein n=1 Tax=Aliiglaciecola litoralis TaxID=582857 RepID=A0ABN1LER7_9ALTE
MFGKLFILFAILPIIEIAILVNVGEQIGGWNTVAIVILTAFIGAFLVRREGIATLMQAQQKMQTGQMPGQEMAEGLLLVIAGVLLVTPGFVTDAIGLLLSFPLTRPLIAKSLMKQMNVKVVSGQSPFQQGGFGYQQDARDRADNDDVIEGEYVDKDKEKPHSHRIDDKPD